MDGKRGELYLPYLPLLYCYWLQAVSEKVTVTITVTQDRRWTARRAATTAALYNSEAGHPRAWWAYVYTGGGPGHYREGCTWSRAWGATYTRYKPSTR